jgi:hypothetical protein
MNKTAKARQHINDTTICLTKHQPSGAEEEYAGQNPS